MARKLEEVYQMAQELSLDDKEKLTVKLVGDLYVDDGSEPVTSTPEQRAEWHRRSHDEDPSHWHTWEEVEREIFTPEEIALADRL